MNKTIKDIVVRTQTPARQGRALRARLGLPRPADRMEGRGAVSQEEARQGRGPGQANSAPNAAPMPQQWVDVQREQLKRLGVIGDWDDPYLTMNFDAEATIVSELLKFAESGQLYRGAKPVMWSPVEKTALAEAEVEYEDIVSTQIDVAFEIVESPIPELVGAYAVIWTTTPWTIPVNQAIAYGPEIEYACRRHLGLMPTGERRSLARCAALPRRQGPLVRALRESRARARNAAWTSLPMRGIGCVAVQRLRARRHRRPPPDARSRRLFRQAASVPARRLRHHRPGTGLVHMAPDHGEDDFLLCKAHGIDPVFAVDDGGFYRADWLWLGGQGSVINAKFNAPDGPICTDLREAGALLAASADFQHSYPHSWRSKAKVIYRCTPQWFIADGPAVAALLAARLEPSSAGRMRAARTRRGNDPPTLRKLALNAIAETRWVPEKGRNRIGAMVEGRPDWVISRQRAWGVPIALYVDREDRRAIWATARSTPHRRRLPGRRRRRLVDAPTIRPSSATASPDDYEMVTDILDVWFDSGSTHAFMSRARYWPESAGRPTSMSKAPTSIAAGSSRRCSKAAAPAAGRLTRRC